MSDKKSARVFGLATGKLIIDEDGNRVDNRVLFEEVSETPSSYRSRVRDAYKRRIRRDKRRVIRAVR